MSSPYARLPAVSVLIEAPSLADKPRTLRVRAAREVLDEARAAIRSGGEGPEDVLAAVEERVESLRVLRLRPVINAMGIVVHTNLGRAPPNVDDHRAGSVVNLKSSTDSSSHRLLYQFHLTRTSTIS